jgi:hypothetical protein
MFRQLGMIGRDGILNKEIYLRCKGKKAPFLLSGYRGIGKTAILQWAYEHGKEPKAFISATYSVKENLLKIAEKWNLEIQDGDKTIPLTRAKLSDLENAILKQREGAIYIDDIQRATPALLRRFKVWRERFNIFCAGVPPFKKEELKRNLWGFYEIKIKPIDKEHRLEIAQKACEFFGSTESPTEIAHNSRGYPGRIIAMAKGTVDVETQRVKGEELDLSPVLLVLVVGLIIFKFVGRGLDDTALYILGGVGMGFAVFIRFFLYRGMK